MYNFGSRYFSLHVMSVSVLNSSVNIAHRTRVITILLLHFVQFPSNFLVSSNIYTIIHVFFIVSIPIQWYIQNIARSIHSDIFNCKFFCLSHVIPNHIYIRLSFYLFRAPMYTFIVFFCDFILRYEMVVYCWRPQSILTLQLPLVSLLHDRYMSNNHLHIQYTSKWPYYSR